MTLAKVNCFILAKYKVIVWKAEMVIQALNHAILYYSLLNNLNRKRDRLIMVHNSRDNTMTNLTSSKNSISKQTLVHEDKSRVMCKITKYYGLGQY